MKYLQLEYDTLEQAKMALLSVDQQYVIINILQILTIKLDAIIQIVEEEGRDNGVPHIT